jgi:hypothetical protein
MKAPCNIFSQPFPPARRTVQPDDFPDYDSESEDEGAFRLEDVSSDVEIHPGDLHEEDEEDKEDEECVSFAVISFCFI